MVRSDERRASVGASARRRVEDEYSVAANVPRWLSLLSRVADALFWIHDNLATLSLIAVGVAAVTLARPMRRAGFPAWTLWAGTLALPCSNCIVPA